jgi:hypothetical protein
MGKRFSEITPELQMFIEEQSLFFSIVNIAGLRRRAGSSKEIT